MKGTQDKAGRRPTQIALTIALLIAVTITGVFFGVTARPAAAIEGSLRIETAAGSIGDVVAVDIIADVGPPGLGAWTVDPIWDEDVLSPVACAPYEGAVCSMHFAENEGRLTGASMAGIVGETKLATLLFRCGDHQDRSQLQLSVEVFADATPGAPADIEQTVEFGAITCFDRDIDSGVIRVGDTSAKLGEQVPVDLVAEGVPVPGLEAWEVNIAYDPNVLAVVDCVPRNGSCDVRSAGVIRTKGSSSVPLAHTFVLTSVAFQCRERDGTSALLLSRGAAVEGRHVDAQEFPRFVNGSITCGEPPGFPKTGEGSGAATRSLPLWLVALLAAFGVAAMSVANARRRRQTAVPSGLPSSEAQRKEARGDG